MTRYDKRVRAFAACLSALAGFVDAVGFVELGGFFVSFMSGNSTRLGVGLAGRAADAALAGWLIAAFVLGVAGGVIVGRRAGARRRLAVLLLVTVLLAAAALAGDAGARMAAAAAMALAMGAENAIFDRGGEVSVGLTYMTGTLVKLGQRLATLLTGGASPAWAPYLVLWAGFVAGAVGGALAYERLGLDSLWGAAAIALLLAAAAAAIGPDQEELGEQAPRRGG